MPLKPAVSSLARQTMRTAFDQLDRTITLEDSRSFSNTSLQQVKEAALDIENQLAARQQLRHMRRLTPLFEGLKHYSKAVEVLCNGTPYLAWIWAPITLILQIASDYVGAFDHIVKGYARIADSFTRFEVLNDALSSNLDFQQTLAIFYADILLFHKYAYKFVRRNSWKILFLTSWGRFERRFENILDDMKRHEELVDLQANAHGVSDIRRMREDINSWREESLEQIQQRNQKESTKQYEAITTWLKADESDQFRILDAISTEGMKYSGTCSWALKNTKISSWLQKKPDSPVLWLQGSPGSGKSVLVTQVVKFMSSANMSIMHHFCSHAYTSSTTYEEILRSLLLQLLRNTDEVVAHVYKECVLGKKPPTVQALEKLFYTIFTVLSPEPRHAEYFWIIIDGLNECDARTQLNVTSLINQIANKTSSAGDTVCKILISSRKTTEIESRLRMKRVVSLTEEKSSMRIAIKKYVSQRLQSFQERIQQLDLGRKEVEDIEYLIANRADGMFLYARLVLDYLSSNIFYSGEEMKASINELPKEISEFYRKILTQILVRLDPRSVDRVKSIFSWIAYAKRPLKRIEFLSALTFSTGECAAVRLVPGYILDICGALVEERPDTTMIFIHMSVKEFLQSPSSNLLIAEAEAIAEHGVATLACLLCGLDTFQEDRPQHEKAIGVIKGTHGFHVYATEFWTEYLLHHASAGSLTPGSACLRLATQLAQRLDEMYLADPEEPSTPAQDLLDDRLCSLKDLPLLKRHVEASLRARSLERLEFNILHEGQAKLDSITQSTSVKSLKFPTPNHPPAKDQISTMLLSYQALVRFLLTQDHYPGVSADDLEQFKCQSRNSAFTCRLSFCPRATMGFESEELCRQHEIAHTRLTMCTIPECKYPPFSSPQGLRNHINKYHSLKPARRSIRRVGRITERHIFGNSPLSRSETPSLAARTEGDTQNLSDQEAKHVPNQSAKSEIRKTQGELDDWGNLEPTLQGSRNADPSQGVAASDVGETVHIPISSIGFRGCAIPGCGARLCDSALEGFSDMQYEEMLIHYWKWHHADSMARCVVNTCQMMFLTKRRLQAHYQQRHTTLFCHHCDANHPEGFALEDELRHHWRLQHLKRVKQWICKTPPQAPNLQPLILEFDKCNCCVTKKKYDRRYDAFKHLHVKHFFGGNQSSRRLPFAELEKYLEEIWVYKAYETWEFQDWTTSISDHEESDDENAQSLIGNMFYVEELA